MSRYKVYGAEGQVQPGSEGKVLLNKLHIISEEDIQEAETTLLLQLYQHVFTEDMNAKKQLGFRDILEWHRLWLGNIYDWAGRIRTVNMAKGDFQFAVVLYLDSIVRNFEHEYLQLFPRLDQLSWEELLTYLADSHVEFIYMHPFREGNGRLSRLLLDVMAVKAGYQTLDYQIWEQHRDYYFKAIQAAIQGDNQHMVRLIRDAFKEQLNAPE